MGSVAQTILDLSLRQRIALAGFENQLVAETIRLLDQSDRELTARIADAITDERSPETIRRLKALRAELRGVNLEAYRRAGKHLTGELQELGARIGPATADILESAIPFAHSFTRPSAGVLRSIITSQPFQGDLIGPHIDKLAGNRLGALTSALEQGLTQGDSLSELLIRVRGRRVPGRGFVGGVLDAHQVGRPKLESLVRTAAQHVQATAQRRVAEENADLIRGIMWAATLDHRTCRVIRRLGESHPGCQLRDGKVWDYDPETGAYTPVDHDLGWLGGPGLAHWACRCAPVSVFRSLDAFERAGVDVSKLTEGERAAMGGPVPVTEDWESWIRKQPVEIQELALGKARAQALRDGEALADIWARSFVVRAVPPRPLAEVLPEAPRPLSIAEIKAELQRIDEEFRADNLALIEEKSAVAARLQKRRGELDIKGVLAERRAAGEAINNAADSAARRAAGQRRIAANKRWDAITNDETLLRLEKELERLNAQQQALILETKPRRARELFTRHKAQSGIEMEADDFLRQAVIGRHENPFDERWNEAAEWIDRAWQRPLAREVETTVYRVNGRELGEWLEDDISERWWQEAVESALADLPDRFRSYETHLYGRMHLGDVPGRVIDRVIEELGDALGEKLKLGIETNARVRRKVKVTALLNERGGRAHAAGSRIMISANEKARVIVHEIAHVLEEFDEEVHDEILRFYARRTQGSAIERMGGGYRDDEITRPDEFLERYMGKLYPGQRATEILSMGLEILFDNPWRLLEDEDYFDFILGLLGHQ